MPPKKGLFGKLLQQFRGSRRDLNVQEIGELQEAIIRGDHETVKKIASAANLKSARTPLGPLVLLAVEAEQEDVAKELIAAGADVNEGSTTELGIVTPLHRAGHHNQLEFIKILLDAGADVGAKMGHGFSPLHPAAWYGYPDAAQMLLDGGADVNFKDKAGNIPLHCAAGLDEQDMVNLLNTSGVPWSSERWILSPRRHTPLSGHVACAEILIQNGSQINLKNQEGITPLHMAAAYGDEDMVKLLVNFGADVMSKNLAGKTPYDAALESGRKALGAAKFLKNAMEINADRGGHAGSRLIIIHADEDKEDFVLPMVEELQHQGIQEEDFLLDNVSVSAPEDIKTKLATAITSSGLKLVACVVSKHLLNHACWPQLQFDTVLANNKPLHLVLLDQNNDDFSSFCAAVRQQSPMLLDISSFRFVQREMAADVVPDVARGIILGLDMPSYHRPSGTLNPSRRSALVRAERFLVENMYVDQMLTNLQEKQELTERTIQVIKQKPTVSKRASALVSIVLSRNRQDGFNSILNSLRDVDQQFLAKEVQMQLQHGRQTGDQQQQGRVTLTRDTDSQTMDSSTEVGERQSLSATKEADSEQQSLVAVETNVKVVILGETDAGKTSLCLSIVEGESHLEAEVNRTIGVDVITHHDKRNDVHYQIYDFGGHEVYHFTHRFFLTRQALYLMSVDLPAYNSQHFQQRIGAWLTSVSSHVMNPSIIVVGTKIDKFHPKNAKRMIKEACSIVKKDIEAFDKMMRKKLVQEIHRCQAALDIKGQDPNAIDDFYSNLTMEEIQTKKASMERLLDGHSKTLLDVHVLPVSSKTFEGIEALCTKMAQMVSDKQQFPVTSQQLPKAWLDLGEKLKAMTDVIYIDLQDCKVMGSDLGLQESGLLNALAYLHVTGQVLFYNQIQGMKEIVFPDPTVIMRLFKQVFRHNMPDYLRSISSTLPTSAKQQFAHDQESFLTTGRVSHAFIDSILGNSTKVFDCLFPLMEHFGLCLAGSVIFPSELPFATDEEIENHWLEPPSTSYEEVALLIDYGTEPPLGLPETAICRMLSMPETIRRLVRRNALVLQVGSTLEEVLYLRLHTKDVIRVRGKPDKIWHLIQAIGKLVEECRDEFPALYSEDSISSQSTTVTLAFEYLKHRTAGDLLKLSKGEKESTLVLHNATEDIFLENQLYDVSTNLHLDWWQLGNDLGLSRPVLDNIQYSFTSDTQRAFQMLKAARQKTEHGPLYLLPKVEEAIQKMGKEDLAKDVQKIYKDYTSRMPWTNVVPEKGNDSKGCTQWYLQVPGGGRYFCACTHLGVVTAYPLNVTYKCINWSDIWKEQHAKLIPVGPLFSIKCEDPGGPVDIVLPHVLNFNEKELTTKHVKVVHVTEDATELLPATEVTSTHIITRFQKGSLFGGVADEDRARSVSRNGLCVLFVPAVLCPNFQLHVYMVSNAFVVLESLKAAEKQSGYYSTDSEPCLLKIGNEYRLESAVVNDDKVKVSSSPEGLIFEDTLNTNKFYTKFRVDVDTTESSNSSDWSIHSKLKFHFRLHTPKGETVCSFIPVMGPPVRQRQSLSQSAFDSDSGQSEGDISVEEIQESLGNVDFQSEQVYGAVGGGEKMTPKQAKKHKSGARQSKGRKTRVSSHDAGVGRLFYDIAEEIGTKWKDLARKLQFKESYINGLDSKHRGDVKDCCMEMLEEWQNKEGENTTSKALTEALISAGLKQIVDELFQEDSAGHDVASGTLDHGEESETKIMKIVGDH